MSTVTVRPGGRTFECEGRQTLLEAALAASISLNYGCSMGTCGLCKARLLHGDIEKVKHHDFALKEADKLNNDFLMCSYTAASSEVVIDAVEATSSADIPLQQIDARAKKLNFVTQEIGILSVQTPRTNRLRFLAGQNARLSLDNGMHTDLPIASCPCDDRNIEFHLRHDNSNEFTTAVLGAKSFPLPVHIDGPRGADIGSAEQALTICLAFDIYIAPLRSWIELQLTDDPSHRIQLCWFTASESDFYLANLFSAWHDAFDSFSYAGSVAVDTAQLSTAVRHALTVSEKASDVRIIVAGPDPFVKCVCEVIRLCGLDEADLFIHSIKQPVSPEQ